MGQIAGLEQILAQHPFFADMSETARGLIAGCASNRVFHEGDPIFREGDAADTFYLVRHGVVALEINVPGREPLVIETLGDGEVVGWSWLVPPYQVRFDARAVGLVRAIAIDGKCLRHKCDEDCTLGYEFYKHFLPVVADRLTAARLQMMDIYGHPAAYAQEEEPISEEPSPPAKPVPGELD
jgi:CRP/FNR family cyclic AMP-dependent transcriptional regulator